MIDLYFFIIYIEDFLLPTTTLENLTFVLWALTLNVIGLFGLYKNETNIILYYVSLELCLLSITLLFIFGTALMNQAITGQVLAIFILTIAACESAIGLTILILFFKLKNTVSVKKLDSIIG